MRRISFLLTFFIGQLAAQFADVSCVLNIERLKDSDRQMIQGLKGAIEQFYSHSNWEQEVSDLAMALDIQIVFLPSVTVGGKKYFQSQILLSNRQDQVYFVKDAKFIYRSGRSIQLSSTYDPLGTLLEFYAYLMIAGELDTYGQMGGSNYYSKAATLAQLSRSAPDLGSTWNARVEFVDDLVANQELRLAKAYFYQGFDALSGETPNLEALAEAMGLFFKSIERVVQRHGIERHTTIFLSGHAEESAEMFARLGMKTELQRMIEFNPDSERIYTQFLKDLP